MASRAACVCLILAFAAAAARAEGFANPPADVLNATKTATALQGASLYPQMSILMGVIKSDPYMVNYLSKKGAALTAFPSSNAATKNFLTRINKYAGVALQNETFTRGVFDYMVVPGKAWSGAELYKAAPVELKTLGGDTIKVTRDPKALYGVLVNGFPIAVGNQATEDKKAVLQIVDGNLFPKSSAATVSSWLSGQPSASGPADAAGPAPGAAAAAPGGKAAASGAAGAAPGALLAAAGAAMVAGLLF